MPCAPLTRLALALSVSDGLEQQVLAAERAQLDLVTVHTDERHAPIQRAIDLASSTTRIGIVASVTSGSAAERIGGALPQQIAQRLGVLFPAGASTTAAPDPNLANFELDPTWLVARTSTPGDDQLSAPGAALIFVQAASPSAAAEQVAQLRAQPSGPLRVFVDLTVDGDPDPGPALGHHLPVITGTPAQLAASLAPWRAAGADGFRLHPADADRDLPLILQGLVPFLRENDSFRRGYETRTLRGHLGLPAPSVTVSQAG